MRNEMFDINQITTNLLDRNIDKILKKFGNFIKGEINKARIDYNFAFKTYIKNAYDKYSKIKTLLYRTEPKYLYDFFECNTLKYHKKFIDSNDINNVIAISHFLVILGTGGIGKTTLLKHFFINELKADDLIPVFVELKDLNKEGNVLINCIYDSLHMLGFNLEEEYFQYALNTGCFIFLLDGFDEITNNKYEQSLREICDFCDQYNNNYFIISSRPCDDFISLQRFTILESLPFSKEQAISLVEKLEYGDFLLKENFLNELKSKLYEQHTSFASNPLLLNIMLMTFDNYAEIPEKLHLFYENAFETLYSKHDATKGCYKREMLSKLSYDNFKKVFARFCFMTYTKDKFEFTYEELHSFLVDSAKYLDFIFNVNNYIKDLLNAICVIYLDGKKYRFSHRSFQEYFTAVFLKDLSDEQQTKASIFLINKRRFLDKVLDMFYDMAKERFEKNIILPILKRIEDIIDTASDRFMEYSNNIIDKVIFANFYGKISLGYRGKEDAYVFLIGFVNKRYRVTDSFEDEEIEKKLSGYNLKELSEEEYSVKAIMKETKLRNFFIQSWLGKVITIITTLYSELIMQQEIMNDDLDKLLN